MNHAERVEYWLAHQCQHCIQYYDVMKRYCTIDMEIGGVWGECDCPRCQGICECIKFDPDVDPTLSQEK